MPRALLVTLLLGLLGATLWFARSAWDSDGAPERGLQRGARTREPGARLETPASPDGGTRASAAADALGDGGREPLRLLLVDKATEEPLPHFLIQLVAIANGARSEHTSDDEGRIEIDALSRGRYAVEAIDHIEQYVHHDKLELEHTGAAEHELRVVSGPTFALRLELPADAEVRDLEVRLESRSPSNALFDDTSVSSPLRQDGARLWCRFRRSPAGFGELRQLVIRDPELEWIARAPTTHERGICPYLPQFHVQFTGQLEFTFEAPPHYPTNDVRIALHPLPGQPVDMTGYETPVYGLDMRGATWGRLPWGDYRVTVTSTRFERTVETVKFHEAELRVPITLQPRPDGGEVSGTVRATDGELVRDARIVLASVDTPDLQLQATIHWQAQPGGIVTGTFLIPAVPGGTWRAAPSSSGWEVWTPRESEVVAPATGLSFEVARATDMTAVQFDVRHAHTKEELHDFKVFIRNDTGSSTGLHNARSGMLAAPAVPDGVPLRWRIERAGFQTLTGDETAFASRVRRGGRDVRVAPVTLVPE